MFAHLLCLLSSFLCLHSMAGYNCSWCWAHCLWLRFVGLPVPSTFITQLCCRSCCSCCSCYGWVGVLFDALFACNLKLTVLQSRYKSTTAQKATWTARQCYAVKRTLDSPVQHCHNFVYCNGDAIDRVCHKDTNIYHMHPASNPPPTPTEQPPLWVTNFQIKLLQKTRRMR